MDQEHDSSSKHNGESPLQDRLAESDFIRASDPGRFRGDVEDVSDIQIIAKRESTAN